MKILVVGAAGMLGTDLVAACAEAGHDVVGMDLPAIDITDEKSVAAALGEHRPDVVANCAAYTNVDGAEEHEDAAGRINAFGAGVLAAGAAQAGAKVVYISTDYVFDGRQESAYVESDPTGPQTAYGRTKLAGEEATAAANPDHLIARTAWLFGAAGPNFVETMLRLGRERGALSVVHDQVGSPTWTVHLAAGLLAALERGTTGIAHMTGGGRCSWYEFAVEIFREAGLSVDVTPVTTAEFPRPAPRPAYSVLDTERQPPIDLPPWQEGLHSYLRERTVSS